METILLQNEDIEDENDDFICNRSVFESLSLIISSTAGAVAALKNPKSNAAAASSSGNKKSGETKTNNLTAKTNSANLTSQQIGMASSFHVRQLTDFEFKNNFHVTRKTFEALCREIYRDQTTEEMPVEKQLALTLWTLRTQDNFVPIAERFGTDPNSLLTIFISTCRAISKLSSQFICWPEKHELSHIASIFKGKTGLPGVIGVIGSTNITVRDSEQENSLGFVSGCLQAICDFKFRFTNVNIDSSVCNQRSFSAYGPFHRFLIDNVLTKRFYIVGGSDFPLSPALLTPFKNSEQLPFQAELFNRYHSLTRTYIHKTFELLKQRFKRLKSLDQHLIGELKTIVMAVCVLHNFILQTEVDSADDDDDDSFVNKDCEVSRWDPPEIDTKENSQNQMWIYSDNDQLEGGIKLEAIKCPTNDDSFQKNNTYNDLEREGSAKRMEVAMSL